MTRLLALALLLAAAPAFAATGQVAGSKHDLSASGPGPYRAVNERSPCVFCHTSHGAVGAKLSNRPEPRGSYTPYESSTASPGLRQVTGASRVCLSCHDGTVAVGETARGPIGMTGGDSRIGPGRRSLVGTDLRSSHPVSVRMAPSAKLRDPRHGDAVRLDPAGQVQCTSCHDPHDEWGDPQIGKFLVKPSERSGLCASCHAEAQFPGATHATSNAQFRDRETNQLRAISTAGCSLCHVSHGADKRGRLLRADRQGDDLCLECHAASTPKQIGTDVQKPWAHATPDRGVRHDAAEGPDAASAYALPERAPGMPRHVACVDCHDPHASNPMPGIAPVASGALAGVWGIDLQGRPVAPARNEYEVCLKCHGDSANIPFGATRGGARRASEDTNLRLVFAPTAASFHPVAAPGKNPSVPGLKAGLGAGSLIRCTDCHASDQGPGAGGSGARGPHGSIYPALLERQYRTEDFTPEGPEAYALCYKCHDRDVLLSDRSGFPMHRKHVVDRSAPCSACHDAHGVSSEAGTEQNNAHLVSFDLSIVRPGQAGVARYDAAGVGHGSCNLSCHATPHGPTSKAFSY